MYLKRLEVKNWKVIREQTLEFGPGLNFIHGPNESGKSSLREALREAFVKAARSRGRSLASAARPWGAGKISPEVRVDFVHQNQDWTLRKVFFGEGSELIRDGRVIAQEDQVQDVLQESLADLTVLWSDQGETGLAAVPTSLRAHLAAAEAVTPGVTWLESEITRLNDEFWTPSRQDPKQLLQDARQRTEREREGVYQLRSRQEQLDRAALDVERMEVKLAALKRDAAAPKKELEQARHALSSWERFRAREAECEKAEEQLTALRGWIERWSRTRNGLRELERQIEAYGERVETAKLELGPEPVRTGIDELNRRLVYCRGRVQVRIREEIAKIAAPTREQIERLEDLVERAHESKSALEQLTGLAAADQERVTLLGQLGEAEAAESAQRDLVTEAKTKAQGEREAARDSANQAEAEIKRLEDGLARWEKQRLRLADLLAELETHRVRTEELLKSLGEEPQRDEILRLQSRKDYVEARLFQVLQRELANLNAPSPEDVARIRSLAARHTGLTEALSTLAEVEDLERQNEALRREVELATERQRSAESALEVARTSTAERDLKLAQLEAVTREKEQLATRWQQAARRLRELADRLANYESRLEQFRQGVGPEPDRRAIETVRNRQAYAEARLEVLLHQELKDLDAPNQDLVDSLEKMEARERSSVSVESHGPKPWMWIVPPLLLGAGAFGVCTVLSLGLVVALVAAVIGLAVGLILPSSQARRERSRVAEIEAQTQAWIREREALAGSLRVRTSAEARSKLAQAAEIRGGLRRAAPPEASSLRTLREACDGAEEIERMDPAGLRELLGRTPAEIEAAEKAWKSAQDLHATRRLDYEALLKESPEALVATQVRQLVEIAETEPSLRAIAPPSTDDAHAWIDFVRSGRDEAALDELIARSQDETRALSGASSEVAELQNELETHRASRGAVDARHQQLVGTLGARKDVLHQQCKRNGVDDPSTLAKTVESVSRDLDALLESLRVSDAVEAEHRLSEAASIRSRFPAKRPSAADLSELRERCSESAAVDALTETDLREELEEIPKRIATAEAKWEELRLQHNASQREYESHLKQNPEGQISSDLDHLRSLVSSVPELGIEMPDPSDRIALLALTRPDTADALRATLKDRAAERARYLEAASSAGDARMDELETELRRRQETTEGTRTRLRKCEGLHEEKTSAFNRFVGDRADVLDFGPLEGLEGIANHLKVVEAESSRAHADREAALAELGVSSIDEAQERADQAQHLEAQMSGDFDSDHLAQLRLQVTDADAVDRLSRNELDAEVRSMPARIKEAEEAWQREQANWKESRKKFEGVIAEDPHKLLEARHRQFDELLQERSELGLTLPADPSDAWLQAVKDEETIAPVQQALIEGEEALAAQRAELERPELDEEDARVRAEKTEQFVADLSRQEKEVEAEIQRHMGALASHSDIYAKLGRAEEAFQTAAATQRDLELEAASRKLLRGELTAAKKDVENDLVGPLRNRMSQRIEQISAGRYSGIRMEADFESQALLTADRQDAPLSDISFGIREQVVFLSRLCLAELLSEEERHLLVFDDNLVHTDRSRLGIACQLLEEVAEKAQIVMMTCHPERYEPLFARATVHQLGQW